MSTRSFICLEKQNGQLEGIYCHHDGYLGYNGVILYENYKTKTKAQQLINLGNISSLSEEISSCTPYNEKKSKFDSLNALQEYLKDSWCEYCYIFTKDKKWVYSEEHYFDGESIWTQYKDLEEDVKPIIEKQLKEEKEEESKLYRYFKKYSTRENSFFEYFFESLFNKKIIIDLNEVDISKPLSEKEEKSILDNWKCEFCRAHQLSFWDELSSEFAEKKLKEVLHNQN